MKAVILGCWLLLTGISSANAEGFVRVSFGVFHSSLRHHGEWIRHECGDMVWRPYGVTADWRPYTVGRWVWTSEGWFWASNEPWGWATYHYGRWYLDPVYGWIWIPDYEWAPAWVEWRYGGDYVGWAPLGPGPILYVNLWSHHHHHWVTPEPYWSFVHCRYIVHHNIKDHVYPVKENRRYIGKTRTSGSTRNEGGKTRSGGPDPRVLEERGKIRIAKEDPERVARTSLSERAGAFRDVEKGVEPSRTGSPAGRSGVSKKRTDAGSRATGNDRSVSVNKKRVEAAAGDRTPRVATPGSRTARVEAPGTRTTRVESPGSRTARVEAQSSRTTRVDGTSSRSTGMTTPSSGRPGPSKETTVRNGQGLRKDVPASDGNRTSGQSKRTEVNRNR